MPRSLAPLAGLLAALVLAAETSAAVGAYERALVLEREGKLAAAAQLLASADLGEEKAAHAAALRDALRSLGAYSVYRRNGQPETARAVLAAAVAKLDPVRDVWVRTDLERRLAGLDATLRSDLDAEISLLLARARALEQDGRFARAATAYAAAAKRGGTDAAPALLREARLGEARAEGKAAAAEDERGAVEQLADWAGDRGRAALGWLETALPFLFLLGLVVLWLRLPSLRTDRSGQTSVALADTGAVGGDRGPRGVALSRELVAEIDALGQGTDGTSTEIDETRDRDSAPILSLAVAGEQLADLDAVVTDDSAIRVGPVSFSLRQVLWLVASPLRRRPARELRGSLTAQGKRSLLQLALYERPTTRRRPWRRKPPPTPVPSWRVVTEGEDSRQSALVEAAARIAVDIGGSYVSDDWRSVRDYRLGVERLAAGARDGDASLDDAERCFRQAIGSDPHNLLAHFSLATVLRSRGENDDAVLELRFLRDLVSKRDVLRPAADRFLEQHQEFELVVRYNLAAALSKLGDWETSNEAIQLLAALARDLEDDARPLKPDDRTRLRLLVTGAHASALVFQLEEWRLHEQTPDLAKQQRDTLEKIAAAREALATPPAEATARTRVAHVQARAAAENAYGRALYVTGGSPHAARQALEQATSLLPDFPDAWLNLASLLIGQERGRDWAPRAEEALDRVDALSPRSAKAKYLRGRLYEKQGRLDDALAAYGKADPDVRTCEAVARIAARRGDFRTAVEEITRSLELSDRVDHRKGLLAAYLIELAKAEPSDPRLLDEAERAADELERRAVTNRQRRWAAELREKIQDLRPASVEAVEPEPTGDAGAELPV